MSPVRHNSIATTALGLSGFLCLIIQNITGLTVFFDGALLLFAQCGTLLLLDEYRRRFGPQATDDDIHESDEARRISRARRRAVPNWLRWSAALLPPALLAALWSWFFAAVGDEALRENLSYMDGALALLPFLVFVCLARWWSFHRDDVDDGRLIDGFFRANRLIFAALAAVTILFVWTGIPAFRILRIALAILWGYGVLAFFAGVPIYLLALERGENPELTLPHPFSRQGGSPLLDALRSHTGLSLHSLWSLGYLRRCLPLAVLATAGLVWYATCFIQVAPGQRAAVYHLGALSPGAVLGPGLHVTAPWPIDRAKIVDVALVRSTAVGYQADQSRDVLWARAHSSGEYTMVTGGGTEVVAINLMVNWRVNSVYRFLTTFAAPENELLARAYRLLLDETATSNVDALLSRDRHELSKRILAGLRAFCENSGSGIDVLNVELVSIHPPIDIAPTYQAVVSAQIDRATATLAAQGDAAAQVASAQGDGARILSDAQIGAANRRADAGADVAQYEAKLASYRLDERCYAFTKTMATLQATLPGHKLYLLGPDVDPGALYLAGGLVSPSSTSQAFGTDTGQTGDAVPDSPSARQQFGQPSSGGETPTAGGKPHNGQQNSQ